MSDELTPEYIERLKAREHRFAVLADAILIETDLRDNPTIKALIAAAKQNFDMAIDEIVEVSPDDSVQISRCLVNIKTFLYMKRALEAVLSRGKQAEMQIRSADQFEYGKDEYSGE